MTVGIRAGLVLIFSTTPQSHTFTHIAMVETVFVKEGLNVPIFHASRNNGKGEFASEPLTLKNSVLKNMFSPDQLKSLVLVKLDDNDKEPQRLAPRMFADGMARSLIFSSGDNHYFGNEELRLHFHKAKQTLGQEQTIPPLFKSQPDAACRYGGLLVSDCFKGISTIENINVKIVDFTDPNDAHYQTGDCHGKVSPQLAQTLGGDRNAPFQFRLAWLQEWATGSPNEPQNGFLAKGTLLPNAKLTEAQGYDIILDRSSIKGISKEVLQDWFPCGDYEIPVAVIGNRNNAKATSYDSSWQFNCWYSEDAVFKDLGPITREKAEELADIQRNPLALAHYIVAEYDKEQQRRIEQSQDGEEDSGFDGNNSPIDQQEQRMITILRADKHGELLSHPKVTSFMREYVAGKWKDLAIKSGFQHSSGMALPASQLERGTVCIPHLPEGDVIVTRYPIVSKDNIRLYNNIHHPKLNRTKNVIWINPKDAEEYHQGDFDGDQFVCTSARKLPNIAKETLRAGEPGQYIPVLQRPKKAYNEITDEQGNRAYTKLHEVAFAASQNSVGLIATNIGRVQASVPAKGETSRLFERRKQELLARLMPALQVEVDYTKNAERFEDIDVVTLPDGTEHPINGHRLLQDCKKWAEQHPSPFFDFKKDEDRRLYRTYPMPADQDGSLYVLSREIINPAWEATHLHAIDRHHFRYLFPDQVKDLNVPDWAKECAVEADDWAKSLKDRAQEATYEIAQRVGGDRKIFNEELGKLYDSFRVEFNELFPTPEEKMVAAAAVWNSQHTRPDLYRLRQECLEVAETLPITFGLEENYVVPSEALPQDAYVLSVPFGERATQWKMDLDDAGIPYDAAIHPSLPMIEFVFKTIESENIQVLESLFGENVIDLDELNIPDNLRIIAPEDHDRWVEPIDSVGTGALAFNLCAEQIAQRLQEKEIEPLTITGIRRNELADEDFTSKRWADQSFTCQVGQLELNREHPDYLRYNGAAVVQVEGKTLGIFAEESAKLAIGATFEAVLQPKSRSAVFLEVIPGSVQLPNDVENSSEYPLTNEWRDRTAFTKQLLSAIQETYVQHTTGSPEPLTPVGVGEWTAYVRPNGDITIRTLDRKTVFKGNLDTQEVLIPLSDENVEQLNHMIDIQPQEKPELSFASANSYNRNSKQPVAIKTGIQID